MFVGRRALALGYLGFVNLLGKRVWYLLRGGGIDLNTRIYFNSHGLSPVARGKLKACVECYLTTRSTLSEELTFSTTARCDVIGRDDLYSILVVPMLSGLALGSATVLGGCATEGAT